MALHESGRPPEGVEDGGIVNWLLAQVHLMSSAFTARFVHFGVQDGVQMVGLADDEYETHGYVLFQRTLNPNPQDVALHQDHVHWEICDQACSGFGGIEQVDIFDRLLIITFESATAAKVGLAKRVSVELALSPKDLSRLREGLEQMMPHILKKPAS